MTISDSSSQIESRSAMLDADADGTAASSPRTPGARTPVATSAADAFTAREHAREVPVRWSFVDEDDVDDSTATVGNVNAEEEEPTTTTVTVDEKPNRGGKRHGGESFSENSDVAKQLYEAARQTRDGLRRRFDSFGVAFDDTVRAFTELADALWATENRKMVFKVLFFCTFAALFYLAVLYVFAHVWVAAAKAIGLRVLYAAAFAFALAMAPPIFPNAAAHALALFLMAAEIALLSVNAVLLGLVHLAIVLNKYVLPSWYHRARVVLRESAGGVDHRGRANAHYSRDRQEMLAELERVKDYDEWCAVANRLDAFPADVGEGGRKWKADEKSDVYDMVLVKVYLKTMSKAREENDLNALGLCLRTVLHRNFAGIDRLLHLRFARVGTKKLVQEFHDEIVASIKHIADTDDDERVLEMLQVLKESYRSLGRTALCLSGGGALAMYHFGVLKTLLREGLCPQVVSGTSGGSIVAAYLSCQPPGELLESIRPDVTSRYGRRWFPTPLKMALHFLKQGVLMDADSFSKTTKAYFGDTTFEEAFALSGRAVSIQVSIGSQTGYVLNHLTSPNVLLRTAVCASCALPGLMRPVEILAKDKNGNLVPFHPPDVKSYDGTITQDIPSARLTELFNCNHFVVSQVNPHLNFVLHLAEESHGRRQKTARSYQRRNAVQKLLRVANFLLLNIKYSIQKLLEVDLFDLRFVRTLQGVLMQDFRGHITILPTLKWRDYSKIGVNPSEKDMERFIFRGEQATWSHIESIRWTMRIELTLVDSIRGLAKRAEQLNGGALNKPRRQNSHGFLEH